MNIEVFNIISNLKKKANFIQKDELIKINEIENNYYVLYFNPSADDLIFLMKLELEIKKREENFVSSQL